MPFFKSSSKKSEKKSDDMSKKAPYPTQQSYPTQPSAYPTQQPPQMMPPQQQYAQAPPAYSQYPGQPQQPPMYYQQQPMPGQLPGQGGAFNPMHQQQAYMPYPPQGQQPGSSTTVVVKNGFDAGARFDGKTPASIPPPPPGCMPNAAQAATQQGHNVVVNQKKGNWMTDNGSDGGMVIW